MKIQIFTVAFALCGLAHVQAKTTAVARQQNVTTAMPLTTTQAADAKATNKTAGAEATNKTAGAEATTSTGGGANGKTTGITGGSQGSRTTAGAKATTTLDGARSTATTKAVMNGATTKAAENGASKSPGGDTATTKAMKNGATKSPGDDTVITKDPSNRGPTFKPMSKIPTTIEKIDETNSGTFRTALQDTATQSIYDNIKNATSAFKVIGASAKEVVFLLFTLRKMDASSRKKFVTGDFSNLKDSDLQYLTEAVFLGMKDDKLTAFIAALQDANKDNVCRELLKKSKIAGDTLKNLLKKFDCIKALDRIGSELTKDLTGAKKTVLFETLKEAKTDAATWTAKEAALAIRAGLVKSENVDKLTDAVIRTMVTNKVFEKKIERIPQKVVDVLLTKMKRIFFSDDWKNVDKANYKKMAGILALSDEVISNLPASAISEAATDGKLSRKNALKLKKKLPDPKNWTDEQLKSFFKLVFNDFGLLKKIEPAKLLRLVLDNSMEAEFKALDKNNLAMFMRYLIKNVLKTATDVQVGQLPSELVASAPWNVIQKRPCVKLMEDANQITSSSTKRRIVAKCKGDVESLKNLKTISDADFKKNFKVISKMSKSDREDIPEERFLNNAETISEEKIKPVDCEFIMKKIRNALKGKSVSSKPGLCEKLGKLAACTIDSDLDGCPIDQLDVGSMPKAKRLKFAKKAASQKPPAEMVDEIDKYGEIIGLMPLTTLRTLLDGVSQYLGIIASNVADSEETTATVLGLLSVKAEQYAGAIDRSVAEQLAIPYSHNNKKSLTQLVPDKDSRSAASNKICATPSTKLPREKIKKLAAEIASDLGGISASTIQALDTLISGIAPKDIPDDVLIAKIDEITDADYPLKDLNVVAEKLKAHKGNDIFVNVEITQFIGRVPKLMEEVDKISDGVLQEIYVQVLKDINEKRENRKDRENKGFIDEDSKEEMDALKKAKNKMVQRIIPLITSDASQTRKRRSTTLILKCDDLTSLGDAVVSVTPAQIRTLSGEEFKLCIEDLNDIEGHTPEQREAYMQEAKEAAAYGSDVSVWTQEVVETAGGIVVSALTVAEINTLQLSTNEAVAAVGKHNYYSVEKLVALYNRMKKSLGKSDSTLTYEDLRNMGHAACGATDTQIADINKDAYKDAAEKIGALNSCEAVQLAAYAKKAKEAYGAVKDWDASTVVEVGNMIFGLAAADLQQLDEEKVKEITTAAISNAPSNAFAALTESQMSWLTVPQASAVTSSQMNALNPGQKQKLLEAGATDKTTNDGSGKDNAAEMKHFSLLLMAVGIMIAMF